MGEILQFGTGRFLRGFFDCIITQPHSIIAIQSRIGSGGADLINRRPDGYHVWTRGKKDGVVVDEFQLVNSLDRALDANLDWPAVLEQGIQPQLKLVVSNTTEAGLNLHDSDGPDSDFQASCPASFPAKLLSILFHRYQAGLGGLTVLPLELVEYNATKLATLVKQQASIWPATSHMEFLNWLDSGNRWLNNLVDRIVVGVSDTPPWESDDPLAVVAEPFRMLAIEDDGGSRDILPAHEMIVWVDDLERIFLRKVRILNGLHTAMVAHSLPRGFETVLDAVNDEHEREWLETLLHEEILPALSARGIDESEFATAVLERFENPFFRHQLADIANGHDQKLKTRIVPTIEDYFAAFGREPQKLSSLVK